MNHKHEWSRAFALPAHDNLDARVDYLLLHLHQWRRCRLCGALGQVMQAFRRGGSHNTRQVCRPEVEAAAATWNEDARREPVITFIHNRDGSLSWGADTIMPVTNRPNALPGERTYRVIGRRMDYVFSVVPHHEFPDRWLVMGGRYGRTQTVTRHQLGHLACGSCGAGCYHTLCVAVYLYETKEARAVA